MRRCLFIQVFLQSHNLLITLYYQRLIIPVLILSQHYLVNHILCCFALQQRVAPPHGGETALLTALGDKREQPDV